MHVTLSDGGDSHETGKRATNWWNWAFQGKVIDNMPRLRFVYYTALLLLLVCGGVALTKYNDGRRQFRFLGKEYSRTRWNEIKSFIHCMTNHGGWTKSSRLSGLLYKQPCMWNRYAEGKCAISSLVENMVGLDYTWTHPNNICAFPGRPDITIEPFDRDNMCRLLYDRNMLVLGDSIAEEFFFSFVSAIFQANDTCHENPAFRSSYFGVEGPSPYRQIDTSKFGCSNAVLTGVRHDYFLMSQEGDQYAHSTDPVQHGMGWPAIMQQSNTSLLVVNRGAHYVEDDIVIAELNATLNAMRERYGDSVSIIFRSTSPGHTDYDSKRYSPPLQHASEANLTSYTFAKYENQNRLVRALIHKHHEHVLYLDVYPSTILRADGHTTEDGLHYCIPGPIDQWTVFLYNVLNVLEKV